jgi:hypothetical protein
MGGSMLEEPSPRLRLNLAIRILTLHKDAQPSLSSFYYLQKVKTSPSQPRTRSRARYERGAPPGIHPRTLSQPRTPQRLASHDWHMDTTLRHTSPQASYGNISDISPWDLCSMLHRHHSAYYADCGCRTRTTNSACLSEWSVRPTNMSRLRRMQQR